MVSFNCDSCQSIFKKPKLDAHYNQRCGSSFTCLDCSKTFYSPAEWRSHTSCISEVEKYEGAKGKKGQQQQQQQQQPQKAPTTKPVAETKPEVAPPKTSAKRSRDDGEVEQSPNKKSVASISARVSSVISSKSATLAEVIESLSKAEDKKEKKIRKELLESIVIAKDGSLSWK